MHTMAEKDIVINRKVLSNIAVAFPEVFDKMFKEIVKQTKKILHTEMVNGSDLK